MPYSPVHDTVPSESPYQLSRYRSGSKDFPGSRHEIIFILDVLCMPMVLLEMPETAVWETILRAAIIYLSLLAVFRIIGRHEFGRLSPFQLILLLIISESISPSLTAEDHTLATGLISAGTLIGMSVIISYAQYKSKFIKKIVSAESSKVIDNGTIVQKTARREMMTPDDLKEQLRVKGIGSFEEVREGYIESDGEISALLYENRKKQKQIQESAAHQAHMEEISG
jgi:uncharacterized membrane protein YcaP (DUF421 family)